MFNVDVPLAKPKKGSASKSDHHIYIWDKLTGNLNTMLHGPKEGLVDLTVGDLIVWVDFHRMTYVKTTTIPKWTKSWCVLTMNNLIQFHPYRPILVTVSAYGNLFIWNARYRENWVAFAPGFQELEENIEYIEREDEFDVKDERATDLVSQIEIPEEPIDIETVKKVRGHAFDQQKLDLSEDESDEYSSDTLILPIEVEVDRENEAETTTTTTTKIPTTIIEPSSHSIAANRRRTSTMITAVSTGRATKRTKGHR
jgi:hypothetical protein